MVARKTNQRELYHQNVSVTFRVKSPTLTKGHIRVRLDWYHPVVGKKK